MEALIIFILSTVNQLVLGVCVCVFFLGGGCDIVFVSASLDLG